MIDNEGILDQAIHGVKTGGLVQKKVAIYSQKVSILLRYIQLSKPNFSRGKAAREILFEIVSNEFPEPWEKILKEIPTKKGDLDPESQWTGNKSHLTRPVMSKLDEAYEETDTNDSRIITIYSPQLAALFKYLDNTTIRFKTSTYGAEILEAKLEENHPEIWAKICKK